MAVPCVTVAAWCLVAERAGTLCQVGVAAVQCSQGSSTQVPLK
jgi:hypothetical protein